MYANPVSAGDLSDVVSGVVIRVAGREEDEGSSDI